MEELKDIKLKKGGEQSLQSQLYQIIRNRILTGRYCAGLKLPASRGMAKELGVSRNTVVHAFEQLESEGYVEIRRGAGSYVTRSIPDHFGRAETAVRAGLNKPSAAAEQAGNVGARLGEKSGEKAATLLDPNVYFAPGVPDLNAFPLDIWKKLLKLHGGRTSLMGFSSNQGYLPLRRAVAQYLRTARACNCHEDQIIITDGAQQAISLAAQVLLKDQQTVYVENPGYIRARQAFQARGCRVQGIDVDEQGIIPKCLPRQATGKVLSLSPTHQYPMGGILSLPRRMEVLQWLKEQQVWLLEDDYDSEFHFYQKPIAAMQSLGLASQVVYMGSFSKVIFPALRLGYLLVPEKMVAGFVEAKSHMSGESTLLEQAVTADFINEGHFNRHLLRMRKRYELKLRSMLNKCADIPGTRAVAQGAGMHLVLQFDSDQVGEDSEIVRQLGERGVNANPLSSYYLGQAKQQGLVLGFANANEGQIAQGMKVIGEVIKRCAGQ